jgi:hypothetical protein
MEVPPAVFLQVLQTLRFLGLGAFLASLILANPSQAETVVERQLAALEPCSGLKEGLVGATLAIDKLESITLSRASMDMVGDVVTLTLQGGLACKTSDAALIHGNASVAINVTAHLNLADCSITTLAITPTAFGGMFASVVEVAWIPVILPKIETETRRMLTEACGDFVIGP